MTLKIQIYSAIVSADGWIPVNVLPGSPKSRSRILKQLEANKIIVRKKRGRLSQTRIIRKKLKYGSSQLEGQKNLFK